MQDHPFPKVSDPYQYRAIGIVRGTYIPQNEESFTRGSLIDSDGVEIDAVLLGRVIALTRKHINIKSPHLWVVYPRCREMDNLHLQISGVWEPSTLSGDNFDSEAKNDLNEKFFDEIPEGDEYFSIRGELIYSKPENNDLVVKIRQMPRSQVKKPIPFKLLLKGNIPLEKIRNFVNLDVRRKGQQLHLENYEIVGALPSSGSKKKIRAKAQARNT